MKRGRAADAAPRADRATAHVADRRAVERVGVHADDGADDEDYDYDHDTRMRTTKMATTIARCALTSWRCCTTSQAA